MNRRLIPFQFRSMNKAGDPAFVPDELVEELRNVVHRPGPRIELRPRWKSDVSGVEPTTGVGYMLWRDTVNNLTKLMLVVGVNQVRLKGTDETWGLGITGSISGMKDYANFRGKVYWMADISGGVPQRYSYDGTVLDIDPFRERLSSESIVAWKDRLWLFNFYQYVNNRLGAINAYGEPVNWVFTNVNTASTLSGSVRTVSWTPTSTSSAKAELDFYQVPSGSEDTFLLYRTDTQGLAPLFNMPVTIEIFCADEIARLTAYSVGAIRRPDTPDGFRYRVKTAGTTAAGMPAFNVVPGSETTDGTVVWVNDGVDAFASQEIEITNATEANGKFQTDAVLARIPAMPSTMFTGVRFKFGTQPRPTWELQPIIVGLKDGLTDGDIRKKNYGHQGTVGKFPYEFFNKENADDAAIQFPNRIAWFEAGTAREIDPLNFFDMVDGNGAGVVIRPTTDYLVAYKRDAISVFQPTGLAGPAALRFVRTYRGVGCVHVRAIAIFEGVHYFASDGEVYRFDGSSQPEPIVGDRMREAIFNKTNWVETAGAANNQAPLLRIHEKDRELYLYTQKAKIWKYNLDRQTWTSETITKDANDGASEVRDLIFFNNKMYAIAETNGLVRQDDTQGGDEIFDVVVIAFDITADAWLHPIETLPPQDTLIEGVRLHHKITQVPVDATLEAGFSSDGGVTFPKTHKVTLTQSTGGKVADTITLHQLSEGHITVRLRYKGKSGPYDDRGVNKAFNLFFADAWIQERGIDIPKTFPATVSATL